jgi:hypothetical protein
LNEFTFGEIPSGTEEHEDMRWQRHLLQLRHWFGILSRRSPPGGLGHLIPSARRVL